MQSTIMISLVDRFVQWYKNLSTTITSISDFANVLNKKVLPRLIVFSDINVKDRILFDNNEFIIVNNEQKADNLLKILNENFSKDNIIFAVVTDNKFSFSLKNYFKEKANNFLFKDNTNISLQPLEPEKKEPVKSQSVKTKKSKTKKRLDFDNKEINLIVPTLSSDRTWKLDKKEIKKLRDIILFVDKLLTEKWNISPKVVNVLLEERFWGYWIAGFTRQDHNPNLRQNLEVWEKLGDTVMKTTLVQFMVDRYPNLTHADISNYSEAILQKREQGLEAQKLGLDKLVLTVAPITIDVAEDTLEAFFGVLYSVGNIAFPEGMDGMRLARIGICNLYSNLSYIPGGISNNPKNQIKEILEKLGYGDRVTEILQVTRGGGRIIYSIILQKDIYNSIYEKYSNTLNLSKLTNVLAEYKPNVFEDAKLAKNKVYGLALTRLREIGITWEWADQEKNKNILIDISNKGIINSFRNILVQENYDPSWFDFQNTEIRNEKGIKYLLQQLLVRTNEEKQIKIILGKLYIRNDYQYRLDLINSYIAGQRGNSMKPPS